MPNPHVFLTEDGHNPEIIFHILEYQEGLTPARPYDELDRYLCDQPPYPEQEEILEASQPATPTSPSSPASVPPLSPVPSLISDVSTINNETLDCIVKVINEENPDRPPPAPLHDGEEVRKEAAFYEGLSLRLGWRTSTNLARDTDAILDRDYWNGATLLYDGERIVRHMTTESGQTHHFSPQWDGNRDAAKDVATMPEGPFKLRLPHLITVGGIVEERVILRHVYLPGWEGKGDEDMLKVSEWKRGIELSTGRFVKKALLCPYDKYWNIEDAVKVLGFPSPKTFGEFAYRNDIRGAFWELWEAHLKSVVSYQQIPYDEFTRRPVGLRILYSRVLKGKSEFDEVNPDKTGWRASSHLARFCLLVEKACQKTMLPPIMGQLPGLQNKKTSSATVAWAGIELAKVLLTQQHPRDGIKDYLDLEHVVVPQNNNDDGTALKWSI